MDGGTGAECRPRSAFQHPHYALFQCPLTLSDAPHELVPGPGLDERARQLRPLACACSHFSGSSLSNAAVGRAQGPAPGWRARECVLSQSAKSPLAGAFYCVELLTFGSVENGARGGVGSIFCRAHGGGTHPRATKSDEGPKLFRTPGGPHSPRPHSDRPGVTRRSCRAERSLPRRPAPRCADRRPPAGPGRVAAALTRPLPSPLLPSGLA